MRTRRDEAERISFGRKKVTTLLVPPSTRSAFDPSQPNSEFGWTF